VLEIHISFAIVPFRPAAVACRGLRSNGALRPRCTLRQDSMDTDETGRIGNVRNG
jgi:hypothetical protein